VLLSICIVLLGICIVLLGACIALALIGPHVQKRSRHTHTGHTHTHTHARTHTHTHTHTSHSITYVHACAIRSRSKRRGRHKRKRSGELTTCTCARLVRGPPTTPRRHSRLNFLERRSVQTWTLTCTKRVLELGWQRSRLGRDPVLVSLVFGPQVNATCLIDVLRPRAETTC
jgi:hypothetical protein